MENELIERTLTMKEIADIIGVDVTSISETDIEDLGLYIETPKGFKEVTDFFVKEPTIGYRLGDLLASGDHKTLVNDQWVMLKDNPNAQMTDQMINIVDIHVPDGNCYLANGQVNHNTAPPGG
jgi:hypothetical protein